MNWVYIAMFYVYDSNINNYFIFLDLKKYYICIYL